MTGACMNKNTKIKYLTLLLIAITGIVSAESTVMEELGCRAAKMAMEQLKFEARDSNIPALTDPGYAQVGSLTSQICITLQEPIAEIAHPGRPLFAWTFA
jgi:hypothetical protein